MANPIAKVLKLGEGRQVKMYQRLAERIGELEPAMEAKTDDELARCTDEYRERVAKGEPLDRILPEAFATVREASRRVLGMRHFDVQLIGAMALNDGHIAEMKTGEGKTLVSIPAGYLNALGGKSVHIVTVNDYLAKRDCEQTGQVYRFLGMTTGLVQNGMDSAERKAAYAADVTYGTNSEFGFDYLRDNMASTAAARVQRGHHFAVVDEVDSILIDEARTPLIISGKGNAAADMYPRFAQAVRALRRDTDYVLDEAKRTITATETGLSRIEERLGIGDIYADISGTLVNHLQQALKAEYMFKKDVDYIVADGEVKIVDEFTGRIMEGRRWSEGLHQAVEAKEGVKINDENQTLATVTLQNYFRLYEKLSGMTGTAVTEDSEFRQIYKLDVTVIPTNRPVQRIDRDDRVYRTVEAKFAAVADEVGRRNAEGQPVLVGTASVENSEKLSRLLDKKGIEHQTLNAKNHEREAHIIAQAGRVGAVTIATNMAGRGTDILLGGNPDGMVEDLLRERGFDLGADPEAQTMRRNAALRMLASADPESQAKGRAMIGELEAEAPGVTEAAWEAAYESAREITVREKERVRELGGLLVIGTERHETRRIDNQLRGRAGRQGDPGESIFYLSLEDDLLRNYAGDRMDAVSALMEKWSYPDDVPIESKSVTKAIENAQATVEGIHFHARKNVLEYDDVMDLQRKAIYDERNAIIDGKDVTAKIGEIIAETASARCMDYCPTGTLSYEWDLDGLYQWVAGMSGDGDFELDIEACDEDPHAVARQVAPYLEAKFADRRDELGEQAMGLLATQVMLKTIDARWMDHLRDMDYLRSGIGLRAIGQRDPLTEYRQEAYNSFTAMTATMYEDYIRTLLHLRLAKQENGSGNGDGGTGDASAGTAGTTTVSGRVTDMRRTRNRRRTTAAPAASAAAGSGIALKSISGAGNAGGAGAGGMTRSAGAAGTASNPYAGTMRTAPCPCGSGKQYRRCHGALSS